MAIKIITGEPGSGKSYYAVNQVILKHFEWSNDFDEWQYKKDKDGNELPVTIFTNIDSLTLPHIHIIKYMDERNLTVHDFFTVEYMRQVAEKYGTVILLIDECQSFFPATFKERREVQSIEDPTIYQQKSVLYFFQWHRHLIPDIYLITQEWTSVCPLITKLGEFEIQAQVRTLTKFGELNYFFKKKGTVLQKKSLRFDKKIGALYQSFEVEDKGTKIRPWRRYLYIASAVFVAVVFVFWFLFIPSFMPKNKAEASPAGSESPSSSPQLEGRAGGAAPRGGEQPPRPAPAPTKQIPLAGDLVAIQVGGVFYDRGLVAVEFFGRLYPAAEFPYPMNASPDTRKVTVWVPEREMMAARRVHVAELAALESKREGGDDEK